MDAGGGQAPWLGCAFMLVVHQFDNFSKGGNLPPGTQDGVWRLTPVSQIAEAPLPLPRARH